MVEKFPFDLLLEKLQQAKKASSDYKVEALLVEAIELIRIGSTAEVTQLIVEEVYPGKLRNMKEAIYNNTRHDFDEINDMILHEKPFFWAYQMSEIKTVLDSCSRYGKIKIVGPEAVVALFGQK